MSYWLGAWAGLPLLTILVVLATAMAQERVLYPVKTTKQESAGTSRPAPQGWRVLEPITYENLSVFPVVMRAPLDTSAFLTLDEGLASGQVIVSEGGAGMIRTRDGRPIPVQGGAQVNRLVLINRSAKPLVLLAGELVSGGKQDRIIAKDRIVPPNGDPLPLDVFCVEHGRWTGATGQFSESKIIVHPSVREKAAVDQKQEEVWGAVRRGTTSDAAAAGRAAAPPRVSADAIGGIIGSEARTESYNRIYKRSQVGQSAEAFAEEVQRRFARVTRDLKGERVVGVVIAYGGEVAWADVFASGAMFDGYWPKLLRSYVVEALARPRSQERASLDDARDFLQPLGGHETIESEPGVYRWRQSAQGRYAEIALEALAPKTMTLHWVKIQRTS